MSYKAIMVPVDLGRHSANRIGVAAGLADRFGAHLIGVAACEPTLPILMDGSFLLDESLLHDAEQRASEAVQQAAHLFREEAKGRSNTEMRSVLTRPTDFVVEQSRAADLIVVGRSGADDHKDWQLGVNAGDVLLGAGRPVLVVPPAKNVAASRIVIAWANTCEARRATCDALPFLRGAEEVRVVAVGSAAEDESAQDVVAWLARHGARAEVELVGSTEGSTTHELLQRADRFGADLIVAGAYGHSRMREWVLGGVTRQLLQETPVCCLMSH